MAPLDPFLGIYAAVTRRTIDGANPAGWVPQQKVSVEDALRAYTATNAYAVFLDHRLGRLTPGYAADIVVLDRSPRTSARVPGPGTSRCDHSRRSRGLPQRVLTPTPQRR